MTRLRNLLTPASAVLLFCCSIGLSVAVQGQKLTASSVTPEQQKFFETSIRPMLAEKCYSCHSATDQRGGLRLDSREAMLKGNSHGPVLAPGDLENTRILQVAAYTGKIQMPPAGKLRPAELAALTAWVKMGAPWPAAASTIATPAGQAPDLRISDQQRAFWSFVKVKKPALPTVKNAAWTLSPIDRLVLAKLEAAGLKPAPSADRTTLIRRAAVDLTGLLPAPADVDRFVNDRSPDSWAKVIDRLLATPQYGERAARHWLDLVRYADSNGLDENVAFANAYRYRDYVVSSLNADKPYSRFITEQLAGDLMPSTGDEQRNERLIATGFLELGPKVLAEPDKDKLVMDIVDEQIEVASKAFIGLTVACARCHNHKFDPIPTKDYYALAGIFKSTRTMSSLNTVAMWEEQQLVSPQYKIEEAAFNGKLDAAKKAVSAARSHGEGELLEQFRSKASQYLAAAWIAGQSRLIPAAENKQNLAVRRLIEAETYSRGMGVEKKFDEYGAGIGVIHTISVPTTAEWDIDMPQAARYQIDIRYASGEARPIKLLLNGAVVREATAGAVTGGFFPDKQIWEPQGVFDFKAGKNVLRIECNGSIPHIDKIMVASVRIPESGVTPQTPVQLAQARGLNELLITVAAPLTSDIKDDPSRLSPTESAEKAHQVLSKLTLPANAAKYFSAATQLALKNAEGEQKTLEASAPRPPMAMAADEGKVADCRVHIRGDTQSLGDAVPRHFVTVLNGAAPGVVPEAHSGRLELAEWLTRPENPLTARVEVNRIWQDHFGFGLVRTPDNFGLLGDRPVNQPLLDWLAATFVEQGWSLKKMHRLIMLSNTYKMACTADPLTTKRAQTVDPENRLYWKMDRRRMDADAYRDSVLYVSGNLDMTLGGSLLSTKNHDYVTNDQSGNAQAYESQRRAIYLPIIRNALYDMFLAFDMGDPSMVNASRSTTTVTPQALFVMNSPFMLNQSRAFARKLLAAQTAQDTEKIKLAYRMAYSRLPDTHEIAKASQFIDRYSALLAPTVTDAAMRRETAWASWCQLLFASNAFIYVD